MKPLKEELPCFRLNLQTNYDRNRKCRAREPGALGARKTLSARHTGGLYETFRR